MSDIRVFNNLNTLLKGTLDSIQYGKRSRMLQAFHIGDKTVKRV